MGYDMQIEKISDDTGYFRLNIWGMSRYASAMEQLGMLMDGGKHPAWPTCPEDFDWDARYENRTLTDPAHIAFDAEHQRVQAWHGEPVHGISWHKFCSNDDWLVTPDEIRAALATYDGLDGERVTTALTATGITERDYWDKWIAYLRLALDNGGIRVG